MKRVPDRQQLQAVALPLLLALCVILALSALPVLSQANHGTNEPNDTPSEADSNSVISGGSSVTTEIGEASGLSGNPTSPPTQDVDYMAFDVSDGDEFTARLIHHGPGYDDYEGDLAFDVINADGTTVATVDDTNPGAGVDDASNYNESITIDPDNEGYSGGTERWYLKVYAPDSPVDEDCPNGGSGACDGEFEIQFSNQPDASISENDGDDTLVEGTDSITFDASGSSDPDGDISEYRWDFDGDGSTDKTTSSDTTTHTYTIDDATYEGGSATFTPEVTVADSAGGTDTATLGNSLTIHNDFDEDDTADINDGDDDDDGIPDSNDPADYNVYPTASDSSSESTDEDSTLTVTDGDSADLTELATDGYESYDPNTDPISIEQVDGESFSAGSTVTLDSGATVTVESDGSWTYDPNGKYEDLTSGDTATDEFTYTVSDDAHSGTAAAEEQATVSITINGVDDAPTVPTDDDSTTNEVAEDDGADTAVGITASSTDPESNTISYSLTDDANGRFTVDSSTGKVTIDDASKLDHEPANSHTITVEASDGTTAVTEDFTVAVTDVVETPTFLNSGPGSVAEDAAGATAHDVDASVDTTASDSPDAGVSYTFTSGNSDGAYAIDSSGQITVADASKLNHESSTSRTVTVEAKEGAKTQTQDITLNVDDADEAPTFTSGTSDGVAEDATNGDSVHDVGADVGGDTDEGVSYAISGGNGDGTYTIDSATGEITVADATQLDHEVSNTRTVTVEASEGTATNSQDIDIDVTDVAETPTFTSAASNSVAEDKTNGATVHDVDADVDAHGTQASDTGVTYAITGGNVDNAFAVDSSTGQVTVDNASAVETELRTDEDITFTVEATEGQQTQTQTVTVDINQVDEVPAFTSGTSASVREDAFGNVLAQDVQADVGGDSDEDVTYDITGGNSAGLFKIDSASGELTVDDFNALDHEDVASVTLTVEASEGSESDTQDVTVDVTDVDETPSIFTKSSSPSVAEDASSDTQIHDVDATVDDADSTVDAGVTYSIVGGNSDSAFAIDSATGEVTVDNPYGVETELYSERTITVKASEGSESDTQDITVDISQVDEVPEFSSGTTGSVAEDATDGTVAHDVEADVGGVSDEDVTYAITGGNSDNAYTINGGSGQITVNDTSKLDHEVSSSRTVTVTASEGTATNSQDIDIDVIDADEQPSFTSSASTAVSESDPDGATVQTVNANVGGSDDESVSYAITGGNDDVADNGGGAFAIDASTGQITISDTADIDESRQSSFSLTVEASEGTATTTQTVTISVTDDVAPTFQSGSSSPADGGTDHAPSENLELEFDENVTLAGGDIRIVDEGDASSSETLAVSTGSVTVSNSTVIVSLSSDLESNTSYHLEVDSGAIEDAFRNSYSGFSDSTTFDFQTADTAPTFTSSNPTVTVDEDGSVDLTSVLEVRDVSRSDNLTWTVVSTPSNGSLAGVDDETRSISGVSSPHTLSTGPTYTPDPDFADGGTPDDSFDLKVTDDNPGTGDTVTVNMTIDSVNDAPTFSLPTNPDQTADNDTTTRTVAGFINTSTFDPGPNESSQAISDFVVSSDNTGLFASQPAVESDGTLTFTPADGVQGTATVDVQVRDNGGTTNGGTDISTARQFEVTVDNRAPSITGFSASNPSGEAVSVSFESDEQLATIDVSISGGGLTLTEGDFSETDNGDGTYTYVATDSGFGEGDYTATLNTAADDAGIGSGSSASDTVVVTTDDDSSSTPTQTPAPTATPGPTTAPTQTPTPTATPGPTTTPRPTTALTQTPTPTGLSDGTDDTPTEDQRQPSGETNANEEFVEPSEIEAVEIVDVWLETAPANSVNATSIVRLDNPSTADQPVDVRFVIDGAVVEERTVVVPADEQINATHSEIVEEAGTHEVAANIATTADDGTTVRTFDFAVGVVELDEDGTEITSSSADPPSEPADAGAGENQNDQAPASQESGDGGVGGPATLLGLVAIVAVMLGALSWRRRTG